MRKNKGYQKDIKKDWRETKPAISWAAGTNKSVQQIIDNENKLFDERIEELKKEYAKFIKMGYEASELTGKMKFELGFRELQYDENGLVPLDKAIEIVNEYRKRSISKCLYGWNLYQKRIIHKDNQKFVYNSARKISGTSAWPWVRVPSLKRSNQVWKRFYELFPEFEEKSHDPEQRRIWKLKKL